MAQFYLKVVFCFDRLYLLIVKLITLELSCLPCGRISGMIDVNVSVTVIA